jgi:CheY-like chemotaxis protein
VTKMKEETKILIIDDDPDYVDGTRMILESASYKVETALSADMAMRKLDKEIPDLILLDIVMEKGADGILLSRKLRQDDRLSKVPIIMITSIREQTGFEFITDDPRHPKFLPVEVFLEKPVPADELIAKIESLLSKKAVAGNSN